MAENGFRLTGDFGLTAAGLSSSSAAAAVFASGLLVVVGLRLRFGAALIIIFKSVESKKFNDRLKIVEITFCTTKIRK